jgi:alpha-glucosidase
MFARRKDSMWILACMCGARGRTVTVPLSFLDEGLYRATLIRDDPGRPDSIIVENATANAEESITIEMRDGGGFIGRFSRQ